MYEDAMIECIFKTQTGWWYGYDNEGIVRPPKR